MSATIDSLVADVISITKRPDITSTPLHVKNALLKAHSADYYLRDIYETNFSFATPASIYQLEIKELIPRFRSMKYLTVIDPVSLAFTRQFHPISIEKFLDGYGYQRTDVFYVAGNQIQIRSCDTAALFGIGCYLYPDTTLASPSWIADEFPSAILYEAARTIFKLIGYDEQSASSERLLAEAMAEVKQTGITTVGE